MQELRLVGVQEDGGHLLLSNDAGEEFTLPVTDALRAAATRPIGRPSAQAADAAVGTVTPRDIQARVRAGATTEQVAAESGLEVERVRTYASPVLAERDWYAQQARTVEVAGPQSGHEGSRSVFGEQPATLEQMVRHRLGALGIDADSLRWDAWRAEDGTWTVTADFAIEGASPVVGDPPPALWSYRTQGRHLENRNRWAQVLSELDPLDGPFGTRRLSAVGDRPFNVEEEEDDERSASSPTTLPGGRGPRPAVDPESQEELLEVLRARRGQRLGVDEEGDEELALMLTRDEQPDARPRLRVAGHDESAASDAAASDTDTDTDTDTPDDDAAEGAVDDWAGVPDEEGEDVSGGQVDAGQDEDGLPRLPESVSTRTSQYGLDLDDERAGEPTRDDEDRTEHTDRQGHDRQGHRIRRGDREESGDDARDTQRRTADSKGSRGQQRSGRSSGSRSKRPSVPSWDEIVFGRKQD